MMFQLYYLHVFIQTLALFIYMYIYILKQTPNATWILAYILLFLYLSIFFSLITLFDNN